MLPPALPSCQNMQQVVPVNALPRTGDVLCVRPSPPQHIIYVENSVQHKRT
jgi:hypothetical protein